MLAPHEVIPHRPPFLFVDEVAEVVLDGAAPRWRFRVLRGADLIASGEVALP